MRFDISSWEGVTFPSHRVDVTAEKIHRFASAIGEDSEAEAPITFPVFLDYARANPNDRLEQLGIPLACILHAEQSFAFERAIIAGMQVDCSTRVSNAVVKKEGALILLTFVTEFSEAEGLLGTMTLTIAVRPGVG